MRILVVEDEPKTGDYLKKGLTESGFTVDVARTGVDGLHLAKTEHYDVIVLDVMLPGMHGWEVLRDLRSGSDVPVLFLTARDAVQDRVKGLELGADDYLTKPFAFAELLARVRTLLRQAPARRKALLRTSTVLWLVLAVGLAAAALWPSTHHVVAQARLEGHGQRVIPAPMDGFLQSVAVRPGAEVKAGQVLATLDDREASLEADRTAAERAQTERQYTDALTREDAAAAEIARARFEQAKAQDDLAKARLTRSRLLAPFDGVLISGDLAASVGSPVKRGQELMVVAPTQAWRVVAEVDESDVTLVKPGQKARLLLAAISGSSAEFVVDRLSPVAQPLEGRNVFEAEGRIEAGQPGLRPGLRGIVRIEAGDRPPLLVWWERGSNLMRRVLWIVLA
jgi:RND family efflux transporter MFP subunit